MALEEEAVSLPTLFCNTAFKLAVG
jgi:hypothetical protein